MSASDPEPETSQRKLAARRANERLKLLANTINAIAIGLAGAAAIVPLVAVPVSFFSWGNAVWIMIAVGLHLTAQVVLGFLRSEE